MTKKTQTQINQKSTFYENVSANKLKSQSKIVEEKGEMIGRKMMAKRREISFLIDLALYIQSIDMNLCLHLMRLIIQSMNQSS